MRKNEILCDRCLASSNDGHKFHTLRDTSMELLKPDSAWLDLCEDCYDIFKQWRDKRWPV